VENIELTSDEELGRSGLVHKHKQGEITLAEAQEVRNLLEGERNMVSQQRNLLNC
jgi:hypothetical protein